MNDYEIDENGSKVYKPMPIPSQPNFKTIQSLKTAFARLQTFLEDDEQSKKCAEAGFHNLINNNIQCVFCGVEIVDWQELTSPILAHYERNKRCDFIQGYHVGNIAMSEDPVRSPNTELPNYDVCGNMYVDGEGRIRKHASYYQTKPRSHALISKKDTSSSETQTETESVNGCNLFSKTIDCWKTQRFAIYIGIFVGVTSTIGSFYIGQLF